MLRYLPSWMVAPLIRWSAAAASPSGERAICSAEMALTIATLYRCSSSAEFTDPCSASAVTVSSSSWVASPEREMSWVVTPPSVTTTSVTDFGAYPIIAARSVTVPAGTFSRAKRPSTLVEVVSEVPTRVILAPPSGAPPSRSTTLPTILPPWGDWAVSGTERASAATAVRKRRDRNDIAPLTVRDDRDPVRGPQFRYFEGEACRTEFRTGHGGATDGSRNNQRRAKSE